MNPVAVSILAMEYSPMTQLCICCPQQLIVRRRELFLLVLWALDIEGRKELITWFCREHVEVLLELVFVVGYEPPLGFSDHNSVWAVYFRTPGCAGNPHRSIP